MSDFRSVLSQYRTDISEVLDESIPRLCGDLESANPWRFGLCEQLLAYAKRGKMIRGALVRATYELLRPGEPKDEQAATLGAVMELIQSFLLIHDDVMDRDDTRRGEPSIHVLYRNLADVEGIADAQHFGESMSICVGDVAFLLAMRLLAELDVEPLVIASLLSVVAREVSLVGVAQMSDLYHGVTEQPVGPDHIETLYVHKTGRYTFSLPMTLGAHLAAAGADTIETLSSAGETLGYVFQLKDDELGIFADQGELGKPVGSDIGGNKKTLLRHRLFEAVGVENRKKLEQIFGTTPVEPSSLKMVRRLIEETGVHADIRREMEELTDQALSALDSVELPAGRDLTVFTGLSRYNLERTE